MRGKTVAQRMWVDDFLERGPLGGFFARMVDRLGSDGAVAGVSMSARKQPDTGLSAQPLPVLPEFVQQLWTEQHIPIFAAFAASDVNHHALTVDVAYFQTREFGTPKSRGVERHQQSAMQGRPSRIDEPRNFFLTENRWQVNSLLRVGSLLDAPGLLESLSVENRRAAKRCATVFGENFRC